MESGPQFWRSEERRRKGRAGRSLPSAQTLGILLGLGLLAIVALDGIIHAQVEGWWFSSLGYGSVFGLRLASQFGIFVAVGGLSWVWLWRNLNLALRRLPQPAPQTAAPGLPEKWWVRSPQPSPAPPSPSAQLLLSNPNASNNTSNNALNGALPLMTAVAIVLVVIGAVELLGLHYGSLAWESFQQAIQPALYQTRQSAIASPTPPPLDAIPLETIPPRFNPQGVANRLLTIMGGDRWQWWLGTAVAIGVGLMVRPVASLMVLAMGHSLGFAWMLGRHWDVGFLALQRTPFGTTDPLFQWDIGSYIFTLPLGDLLEFWLIGLTGLGLFSVILIDLLGPRTLERGYFVGLTVLQQRHGCRLLGGLLVAIAISLILDCFELVYSPRGATYGASFTDVWVQFPANASLGITGAVLGLGLLGYGITGQRLSFLITRVPRAKRRLLDTLPRPNHVVINKRLPMETVLVAVAGYTIIGLVVAIALPQLVNAVIVKPNELEREKPFIARNIEYTRQGFGLEDIQVSQFEPDGAIAPADILKRNSTTLENIRLWDTRPLLETNRQLQQIRPYYRFASGDIDRYQLPAADLPLTPSTPATLTPSPDLPLEISLQQVILSMREIDPDSIPSQAQTWVNRHLAYTHGYGFTLSPVNRVGPGGLPQYFVKDINTSTSDTNTDSGDTLTVDPPALRQFIPIDRPRIYYGELPSTYVMAPSKVDEFDYPSGDTNAYNHYDGRGGVRLSNPWRRLAFAWTLRDWQMLFARNLTPDTKILFHRRIRERVQAIAPFLRYDSDPYGVVVDVNDDASNDVKNGDDFEDKGDRPTPLNSLNHLFWIIDAYTVSDRYPYSEPNAQNINYIRNSVKVIIDAYDGTVRFYTADPKDPIIQTWQRIFPTLFQSLDTLPPSLRRHLRYGNDLFSIQSERLLTYHMDNPQVFYNREDVWEIPSEIYDNTSQPVASYFAILRLSKSPTPEFVQLLPFSPTSRNNLVAWLAARSDGDNYGKLLLYQFPKDQPVFGVEQVEARINQEPDISEQIALWNREGSRAVQGNLLVIPLQETLLYVEPVYLEAVEQGLPTLARVIVVHNNQIVMKPSLEEALSEIFQD